MLVVLFAEVLPLVRILTIPLTIKRASLNPAEEF